MELQLEEASDDDERLSQGVSSVVLSWDCLEPPLCTVYYNANPMHTRVSPVIGHISNICQAISCGRS
eukprot:scaffold168_cov124-Cylindrotheca_fusiformis.AAC.4